MRVINFRNIIYFLVMLTSSMIYIACDGPAKDLPTATVEPFTVDYGIQVLADKSLVNADGTAKAEISARLYDVDRNGPLGSGNVVTFTTTLGAIPYRALTDGDGIATADLFSNDVGIALVTAIAPDLTSDTISITFDNIS